MSLVKYNNNSISAISATASMPSGALVPIKNLTASSSATLSFVHGSSDVVLDSTYPIYIFKYINIHPATDGAKLTVNFRDGSTAYDATKTTTMFSTYHQENDGESSGDRLNYQNSGDLAQGTGFQELNRSTGNADDEASSGELFLFNPSSTVFVKHFIARTTAVHDASAIQDHYVAGYCNVTAAIDAVQFKMNSGNMDSGKIKLYGIKDS